MDNLDIYTSTGGKYSRHPDMINALRNGVGRPQSLQVALTNRCNLKCVFCSVAERELKQEWDYEELLKAIDAFIDCGIKTIEFSGGGEPTLHPRFPEIARLAKKRGLKLGLITNGIKLKDIPYETLANFEWIRVSCVSIDYGIDIEWPLKWPHNVILGLSYVVGQKEYQNQRTHWQSDIDQLNKIQEIAIKQKVEYIRIVPDCHSTINEMLQLHEHYGTLCKQLGKPFMFQYKMPHQAQMCYMDSIKPWLETDGYVYPCNSIPLNNNSGFKFNEIYRLCHWTEIAKYYKNRGSQSLRVDSCDYCVFTKNNEIIENLLKPVMFESFV